MAKLPLLGASLLAIALPISDLDAHVRIASPNGGEVLRVGTRVTIKWVLEIAHPQKDWDLWYSTSGARGPWIPIKMDMPVAQLSFVWTVPDTIATKVRFRIRQDNFSFPYEDISDKDTTITPSLAANVTRVSLTSGGTQTLALDAGPQNAGRNYWVAGSITGTKPGIRLGPVTVPLRYDAYTDFTFLAPNSSLLSMSLGKLDAKGRGKATFNVPKGFGSLVGLEVYHAFITFAGPTIHMASNPVSVKLIR